MSRGWREKNPKRYWAHNAHAHAKRRAEKAGVPFDLTVDDIMEVTGDECPVFKTPFLFLGNRHSVPESATIDRLRSEAGYVKENIVIVSNKANLIKNGFGPKDMYLVADFFWSLGVR